MTASDGTTQAAALMSVLALEEREPDLFVGKTPDTTMQRIFGGQVAGQALMAAALTLPEGRSVHSLHSYFLRPGDPNEEIRYAVERMRDGRTFSTRRVVAWQRRGEKDAAIFALTADASAGRPPTPSTRSRCPTSRSRRACRRSSSCWPAAARKDARR